MPTEVMSVSLRNKVFDNIRIRMDSYLSDRVLPWEIAASFDYVLHDEFHKLREDPGDEEYLRLKDQDPTAWPPVKSLQTAFTGFYAVDPHNPEQTRPVSWQGGNACTMLPIKAGQKGIINRAMRTGQDQYVPIVGKDPDHHACDPEMEEAGTEVVLLT